MCNFAFGDAGEFVRSLFPPRHAFRFEVDNSGKVIEYLLAGLSYCAFRRGNALAEALLAEK